MNHRILVFIKQVPDTKNITGNAMKPDGTVNRQALPAIFNPEDLNALELALDLKDRFGAEVVVATMGPPSAAEALRNALMRGADKALLLTDRAFAGADTLATSYALSCCAKKVGDYDLILCGRQAIDGDTAQVGPQLAEKLKLPQISYTESVADYTENTLTARRQIEGGYEVLKSPLPCLCTVVSANEPRPENAVRIMKYKKARTKSELVKSGLFPDAEALAKECARLEEKGLLIAEWSAKDVNAIPERIGFAGSPTKVKQIMSVVLTAGDYKNVGADEASVRGLIRELIEDHTLG